MNLIITDMFYCQRMDELEDAKETPEEMASNFTCAMFETPQDVLKGARHMVRILYIYV